MYKTPKFTKTSLRGNPTMEGETLEQKVERIVNNGEPITDGAPIIYTEKSKGVQAGYNIRTDRWEVATEAMDAVHKVKKAKRAEKPAEMKVVKDDVKPKGGEVSGAES